MDVVTRLIGITAIPISWGLALGAVLYASGAPEWIKERRSGHRRMK